MGGVFYSGLAYITDSPYRVDDIVDELANHQAEPTNVYLVPKALVQGIPVPPQNPTLDDYEWTGQLSPTYMNYNYAKPSSIDGYVPTNNKLFCFPYNYLILSNNSGSSCKYKFEHFTTADCEFKISGVPVARWLNINRTIIL